MVPLFSLWILVSTAVVDSQLSADQTILLQIPSTSSDFQVNWLQSYCSIWLSLVHDNPQKESNAISGIENIFSEISSAVSWSNTFLISALPA